MFCKKCGTEIKSNAKFCPRCGAQFSVDTKPKKKRHHRAIAFITSLVLILGAGGGVFVFHEEILRMFSGKKQFDENNVGEIYYQEVDEDHIATSDSGMMYADNEILLVTSADVSYKEMEKLAEKYDAEIVGWIEQTGDYQLKLSGTYAMDELDKIAADLENESIVDLAYANYVSEISTESLPVNYGKEWSGETWDELDNAGSNWGLEAICALSAWDIMEKNEDKINPVKLGLIDNGFDTAHEDLEDSFVETFYNTSSQDHGTHVAGIMAANSDNDEGICGVYPYGNGNLYGVSFSGVYEYAENKISCMLEKCAFSELILRGVKIINCSYGLNSNSLKVELYNDETVKSEIEREADVLTLFFNRLLELNYDFVIVKSAGNWSNGYYTKLKVDDNGELVHDDSGAVMYDDNGDVYPIQYTEGSRVYQKGWYCLEKIDGYITYPAILYLNDKYIKKSGVIESKYSDPISAIGYDEYDEVASKVKDRIIVVGSVNSKLALSSFSNGGERVDVFAPGENIFSTVVNGYDFKNGTSMAAPHVAGVAAMVWASNNNLSGDEVKEIICNSGKLDEDSTIGKFLQETVGMKSKTYIEGNDATLVNAQAAVKEALGIEKEESTTEVPENGGILCWVVNKEDEDEKIVNATVTAENVSTSETYNTITDDSGHFELILPEGTYMLTVTAEGYETYTSSEIEVKNEGVNYLDDWIKMTPEITIESQESSWQEACKKALESFRNSDEYEEYSMWDLYDMNQDDIPELIISKGNGMIANVSTCYVYAYNGSEFKQLSAVNAYGSEQNVFGYYGEIYIAEGKNGFSIYNMYQGYEFTEFFNFDGVNLMFEASFENNSGNVGYEDAWYKYNNNDVSQSGYNSAFEPYKIYAPFAEGSIAEAIGRKYSFEDYEANLSTYYKNSNETVSSGKCGDNANWNFNQSTGTLTISGYGDIYDYGDWGYDGQSPPWYSEKDYGSNIKSVIIEEGITGIGEYCFCGSAVSSVKLPESLKKISMLAFHDCENLKEITIPKNVIEIESDALGKYGNGDPAVTPGFTVYGYAGSSAQEYCNENGINFVDISSDKFNSSSNDEEIPDGYVSYKSSCYFLFDTGLTTWEEAEAYCESLGGHLAVISSQEENEFLFDYMKQCGYESAYFGYSDSVEEGTWKWVDGENSSYENWSANEPNKENSDEDYAMFYYKYTSGAWNDGDFGNRTNGGGRAFICEWNVE